MLKLTNSFYRYLAFTCEKVNETHVRKFSHLNCKRKTCGTESVDLRQAAQFHLSIQLCQHGYGKKRFKIKIPPLNSNECKTHDRRPMSEQRHPTISHASYGGEFDVVSDNDEPFEEWRRQNCEAASSDDCKSTPLTIPPNFRVWENVAKSRDNKPGSSFKFKIVSYNVLAQYLLECHPYLYTDCSPSDLKWKARASRIYDEITSLAPDILCLQEVQASHLQSFYSKFEKNGYCGIFKQKTGNRQDGCAIYFKKSLFELKDQVMVEFYQPQLPILNRDNIGIMVKLVPCSLPGSPVVVATTHLLYNPKRTDVRLAQMQVFLAEIDRFAYFDNGREAGHLPIIMTGDFNSTPDSAVINLLDVGHVSASPYRDSSDWKRIGVTDNCQHLSVILNRKERRPTDFNSIMLYNSEYSSEGAQSYWQHAATEQFSHMFNSNFIGHSLKLCSVYQAYNQVEDDYVATTFQDYWITVDYIYFSLCSTLKLVERLRLPTAKECEVLGRLPNKVYGSDHLALAALFELKPYKSTL